MGQVPPYVGGQVQPAYPFLRTWRITGSCPPSQPVALSCIFFWGEGSACPPFGGAHGLRWEEKSCGPPRSWARAGGSPCPGDEGPQAALARPPTGWPCSALGTDLLCPQQAPGGRSHSALGPGVARSLDLGDLGSLQAPKVASRQGGGLQWEPGPSLTMSVSSNAAAKSLLNKKADGVKVRHRLGPGGSGCPPAPACSVAQSPKLLWASPVLRKGCEPSFSP